MPYLGLDEARRMISTKIIAILPHRNNDFWCQLLTRLEFKSKIANQYGQHDFGLEQSKVFADTRPRSGRERQNVFVQLFVVESSWIEFKRIFPILVGT